MRIRAAHLLYILSFLGAFLIYIYVVPLALSVTSDDNDWRDDGGYFAMQRGLFTSKISTTHAVLPVSTPEPAIFLFIVFSLFLLHPAPVVLLTLLKARAPPFHTYVFVT